MPRVPVELGSIAQRYDENFALVRDFRALVPFEGEVTGEIVATDGEVSVAFDSEIDLPAVGNIRPEVGEVGFKPRDLLIRRRRAFRLVNDALRQSVMAREERVSL